MKNFHSRSKHNEEYDLKALCKVNPHLLPFIVTKYNKQTVDFSSSEAVRQLNKALLFLHYGYNYWEFPKQNLCPPIPGRVDYIHHLADLIEGEKDVKVLDIGTGATCIYPLLGIAVYNWQFVATDIDKKALDNAKVIIERNNLSKQVQFRKQVFPEHVLNGVVKIGETFTLTMCNPPFHKSKREAMEANARKTKNLGLEQERNFAGTRKELWTKGGEHHFLNTYLYESSKRKNLSKWFTSLVAKVKTVETLMSSAEKLGAEEFKVIEMSQGNKVTRMIAWRF